MKHQLYPWQEDCLRRWFSNHGRGMVQAVTGSGKTLLALTAADRLAQITPLELRVKIVVPTSALMRQWERALKAYYPENVPGMIGLKGGGHKSPPDRPYMIYVINSARYELARQILAELRDGCAVLLVADECHRYASGQNRLIFEFLPHMGPYAEHFFSLGLSATLPGGQTGRDLSAALGRKIYNYEMSSALMHHTVCPYDIFHIGLCFQTDEQADYNEFTDRMAALYAQLLKFCPELGRLGQRERFELLRSLSCSKNKKAADAANQYMRLTYRRKSLVCMASARLNCALDLIRLLGVRNKILVFSERIKQAETLYERLSEQYPGKVGRCHSRLGALADKNAIERFRSGDIRILIACKAIDEGADIPDAAVGIILSGTSAQRQRIQRLGRIIRKSGAKTKALLYYLHIEDSSEDSCFLPDVRETSVIELEYRPDSHTFFNPPYAQRASRFLEQIESADLSKEKMQEITRCLALGSVRADWTLPEELLTEQIRNAESARERNYWICMKKLSV